MRALSLLVVVPKNRTELWTTVPFSLANLLLALDKAMKAKYFVALELGFTVLEHFCFDLEPKAEICKGLATFKKYAELLPSDEPAKLHGLGLIHQLDGHSPSQFRARKCETRL